MRSALIGLGMLAIAGSASAQSTCRYEERSAGELVEITRYQRDALGHVTRVETMLDPVAYTVHTTYAYGDDGDVRVERSHVLEGPILEHVREHPPTTVTHERRGRVVIERRSGGYPLREGTTEWVFDERGLPAHVVVRSSADGDRAERWWCAFDLDGRPIYVAREGPGDERHERRLLWSGDALVRVEDTLDDGETSASAVRRREDGALVLTGADGAAVWTGACEDLMLGECSPALAPIPASTGQRARVPRAGAAPRPAGRAAARAAAFPGRTIAAGAPLTLRAVRDAFPGRAVWTSVTFAENSPVDPVPMICVGSSLGQCSTGIVYDTDARPVHAWTRDRRVVGPSGLRAGARYASASRALGRCEISLGLEVGVRCPVRGNDDVVAWLDVLEPVARAPSSPEEPAPGSLARARIARLEWVTPH